MTSPESASSSWTYAPGPGGQTPQQGKGLAITAIVLSTLALLGLIIVVALGTLMFFAGSGFDNQTLHGRAGASQGQVSHSELEPAIRKAIEDDGGAPSRIECPETSKVGPGLSVMCDTTIDDTGWVAVVVFANDEGEFTLTVY